MRWGPHLRGAGPGTAGHRRGSDFPRSPKHKEGRKQQECTKKDEQRGGSGEKGGRIVKGGETVQTETQREVLR